MRIDGQRSNAGAYWWTYTGYKGQTAYLLAHNTRDSAEWHHGMAQSLGGAFDAIGITKRACTETEIADSLRERFAAVEIVNRRNPERALAQALPTLNPTASPEQHASAAARMLADMEGGAA